MKKFRIGLLTLLALVMAAPAFALDLSFHGDLNNRFLLYSNHVDFFKADQKGTLDDGTVDDTFAEIKYRFWFDAATDDGNVKGVFATEIGGLRFGESGKMPYSGDKIAMEVRWAYLDFQLPMVESKSRVRMGLQPFTVNEFLWKETVGGVKFYGDAMDMEYTLAWIRGHEVQVADRDDDAEDADGFLGRLNLTPMDGLKTGIFLLYQMGDSGADSPSGYGAVSSQDWQIKKFAERADMDIWTLGVDGKYTAGDLFVNWDLMYQTGDIDDISYTDYASGLGRSGDFDLNAYFAHFDVGINFGNHKLTYTFWYASGDDDAQDGDLDAFIATDLDRFDSICIMEGGYLDDDYFTERPYILDKGLIMNKIALDSKLTQKATVGMAVLYMMTAEDIEYTDNSGRNRSSDNIGIELDAYFHYQLYKNVQFGFSLGYLMADDAMDVFEVDAIRDGDSDEDIFAATSRVRFKF